MTYCGTVVPNIRHRSKVPSPRLASAQELSTIVWPWAARVAGPPGRDGASAMPIARNRLFIRVAAASAAGMAPPPATIDSDANCAEPANTNAATAIACHGENPAWVARTP